MPPVLILEKSRGFVFHSCTEEWNHHDKCFFLIGSDGKSELPPGPSAV